ncbi:MAG: pyridoxal-phosphate dependent enzyme, partial [Patescibacteria group bacterium]
MPQDKNYYTCPDCGNLFLPERDEDHIRFQIGQGVEARAYFDNIRYGPLRKKYPYDSGVFMRLDYILPGFPKKAVLSLREGFTDLFEPPDWFKKEIGLKQLFVKMEGQSPSGSFKDRGMSVAVSETRRLQLEHPELGIKFIACASTGDTSASAAEYAAYYRDKLQCVVFLPYEKISDSQLAQAMMAGAIVIAVKHP